jgi:WD40 repeat protein
MATRTEISRIVLAAWTLVIGLLAPLGRQSSAADPPQVKFDTPTPLAKVAIPPIVLYSTLAWSADGTYLAAGPFVVDIAKKSVATTLKVSAVPEVLAFSPDGKWLAVGSNQTQDDRASPTELVVFDIPAFTRKFTAKASKAKKDVIDLAWSADGKSLFAIEGSIWDKEQHHVRRWAIPAFTEQPAIRTPQSGKYSALAVSPDGNTLAVGDGYDVLRLFDPRSGAERTSFQLIWTIGRLGFAPDGKTIAVFDTDKISWVDATTGKAAKPNPARVAIQPTSLYRRPHVAVSPDGSKHVEAGGRLPLIFDKVPKNEQGLLVRITDSATGKTWNWRFGEGGEAMVTFSPDGTKLAGVVRQSGSMWLMIWAVPK